MKKGIRSIASSLAMSLAIVSLLLVPASCGGGGGGGGGSSGISGTPPTFQQTVNANVRAEAREGNTALLQSQSGLMPVSGSTQVLSGGMPYNSHLSAGITSANLVIDDAVFTAGSMSPSETGSNRLRSVMRNDDGSYRVVFDFSGATNTAVNFPAGTSFTTVGDSSAYVFYPASADTENRQYFSYMDAALWAGIQVNSSAASADIALGFAVYGQETLANGMDALPTTGSATYNGVATAIGVFDGEEGREAQHVTASVMLTANFQSNSIDGMISNFGVVGSNDPFPQTTLSLSNGTISGTSISASIGDTNRGFTGSLDGQFYGPMGAELGGVFSGTSDMDNGNVSMAGAFMTRRVQTQ